MSKSEPSVSIDPELQRQLDAAATSNQAVEVVVRLRPDDPSQVVPSPERTKELAEKVLKRVKKRVGNPETRHNVFTNLGSFVVSASPDFVRGLISQPEVAAAVANRQPGSAAMPPVEEKSSPRSTQKKSSSSSKRTKGTASARHAAAGRKSGK